jgi:hypothetical protein
MARRNDYCDTAGMPRRLKEGLLTIATLTILLIVLVAADQRVREGVTRNTLTQPSAQVTSAMSSARRSATMVAAIAREESQTHTLLLAFSVAAAVLLVFMLRT